jgi:phosphoadenosine phosphosulfate reductase
MTAPYPEPGTPPSDLLRWAMAQFGNRFVISTSFQREGMVLLDMAARLDPQVRVITLDTGRLPEETHTMIEMVRERYGVNVEMVSPDAAEVERMVTQHGPNLFYGSVPERKLCCQIRKVRPLERKLKEVDAYAVGLRREQSETRESITAVSEDRGKVKLSPLADWSNEQVRAYIAEHNVPQHPLYEKGYPSIGCGPCTRPTLPGEGERAGRWWWEDSADKECGLHFTPSGKVLRTVDVLLEQVLQPNA